MAYPGYLRYYDTVIEGLAGNGHEVLLGFELPHKQSEGMKALEGASERIADLGRLPQRHDSWQPVARHLRRITDYVRYLHPSFADADYLRDRAGVPLPRGSRRLLRYKTLSEASVRRALRVLLAIERALPTARRQDEFLAEVDPDIVVFTPLLTDASLQNDLLKSARARGIPTVMGVASWDHLTTKGMVRVAPDRVLVWNDIQRQEATELHFVPGDRIVVTGAQPFDRWFGRSPRRDRRAFAEHVGLRSDAPFILFVGSTASISHPEYELAFVRRWIEALRASGDAALCDASVLVRPHPYNPGLWLDADLSELGDVAVWPRGGANPVDPENRDDYFESLHYSSAVVGINTSAFIEAAIVGRAVLTIRADEFAGTQGGTVHFHYLRPEHGGPLEVARDLDEHVAQLSSVLADPARVQARVAGFVDAFVRPRGRDTPATPIVVETIEVAAVRRAPVTPSPATWPLAAAAWCVGMALSVIDEGDQFKLRRALHRKRKAIRKRVLRHPAAKRAAHAQAALRGRRSVAQRGKADPSGEQASNGAGAAVASEVGQR